MKRIEMNELAEEEFVEILSFHDRTWLWLGRNLYREFQELFGEIRQHPQQYPIFKKSFRFAVLPKSPFIVYFEELNDRIWIACIAHDRRKSGFWMRRKPPKQ